MKARKRMTSCEEKEATKASRLDLLRSSSVCFT